MSRAARIILMLVIAATAAVLLHFERHSGGDNQAIRFPSTTINGHPTKLSLDTGSGSVVIWQASTKRLGLAAQRLPSTNLPGKNARSNPNQAWLSQPARLTVGRQQMTAPLTVMNAPDFEGDGIIGWPEVRDLLLVFDPVKLVVRATNALPTETARWFKFKIRRSDQLFVELPIEGGKTGVLLMDTGSPAGVSLAPNRWQEWRRAHPRVRTTPVTYHGLNDVSATTDWAWGEKVSIGNLTLSDVNVGEASVQDMDSMPADYMGTFGLEAISRLNLVVDGHNGFVYLKPRAAGTDYINDNDWMVADSVRLEADNLLVDAAEFQFGADDLTASLANVNRALTLNSNNLEAWTVRSALRSRGGDNDGAMADATRALQLDSRNVAAWLMRADARNDKGDWNGAVSDYSQALQLEPSDSGVLLRRGTAREAAGDWPGAIADFTRVTQLEPTNADSWLSLGAAREGSADYSGALANFETAMQMDLSNSDYATLYHELLLLRLHKPAAGFAAAVNAWREGWAKNLARFLAGQLDEKALLAAAEIKDVETVSGQKCEAYYFIGMKRLIKGDHAGAREFFQKSLATREKDYYEYQFARAELKRLDATPGKPR